MDKHETVIDIGDIPPPSRKRRAKEPKLATLRDVQAEMTKMYRKCFYRKEISSSELSRAVFALRCVAEIIEATDFEEKLKLLEDKPEDQP